MLQRASLSGATTRFATAASERVSAPALSALNPPGHAGHAHFWERALSRRQLVGAAAGATVLAAGFELWLPGVAAAAPPGGGDPKPIPETFSAAGHNIHILLPGIAHPATDEPITITDFNGAVAMAVIDGAGTGTQGGVSTRYTYEADLRIMDGVYVDVNGATRAGAFGMI